MWQPFDRCACRWPKTQPLRWTVADREARLDGKCPSYSLYWALCALRSGARSDLVLENLALRQQLALLRRRAKRPRFGQLDRLFWMWLSQRWREALHVVVQLRRRQRLKRDPRSSVAADRSGSEDTEGRRSQAFVAADIVAGGAIFPVGRAPVVPDRCLPDPEMGDGQRRTGRRRLGCARDDE